MSKLLQERWQRLAFGMYPINESGNIIDRKDVVAMLKPLEEYGFYFANSDSVVLGELDEMSGKEYESQYPYDSYMADGGPFHVQVSVDLNSGNFVIHNYTEIDERFCSTPMPKEDTQYSDLREVSFAINDMIKCYEEFMEAYEQIDAAGAVTNEYYRYIDSDHPVAQRLMKK